MASPRALSQQSFDSLSGMMEAWAEEAVRIADDDHGITLDFTAESIARLETVLAARSPIPEAEQEEETRLWGAWYGEVFRRRYPAEWIMAVYPGQLNAGHADAGSEIAMPALNIQGSHVYPLLKIFRRLTLGPGEDLAGFYARVSAALDGKAGQGGKSRR
jgi:hypothetical protein